MEPIEIPREIADAEGVPEDLDSGVVGPYRFPNPRRRRIAAILYGVGAVIAAAAATVLTPGFWVVTVGLVLLAGFHGAAAWNLAIEQEEALDRATQAVDFPVGHVSAAIGFEGWRSRPVWNVIVYSASEPPDRRALVRLDGQTGAPLDEVYEEPLNVT